ncbi:MAG: hypothetical protein V7720_00695 [Halioglobus sp.]
MKQLLWIIVTALISVFIGGAGTWWWLGEDNKRDIAALKQDFSENSRQLTQIAEGVSETSKDVIQLKMSFSHISSDIVKNQEKLSKTHSAVVAAHPDYLDALADLARVQKELSPVDMAALQAEGGFRTVPAALDMAQKYETSPKTIIILGERLQQKDGEELCFKSDQEVDCE